MKYIKKNINNKKYYKYLKVALVDAKRKINKIMQEQETHKEKYEKIKPTIKTEKRKRKIKKEKTNKNWDIIIFTILYLISLLIYAILLYYMLQFIK